MGSRFSIIEGVEDVVVLCEAAAVRGSSMSCARVKNIKFWWRGARTYPAALNLKRISTWDFETNGLQMIVSTDVFLKCFNGMNEYI